MVTEIQVETILRLAELENVIAIKECTNTDNLAYLIEKLPKDFLVYTGEDGLAFHTKALGGQGVISVFWNRMIRLNQLNIDLLL